MTGEVRSHRRQNLLTGEWVLVSPQRTQRPWLGQVEATPAATTASYDESCYLCPGNQRVGGQQNPSYSGPFVFNNDFPALSAEADAEQVDEPLFRSRPETGHCRVVCFSDRHDLHLTDMSIDEVTAVLRLLSNEFNELDEKTDIEYVQVFENRGEMMGCSNPHPHAQIWATSGIPVEPDKELRCQQAYLEEHGSSLLTDYIAAEEEKGDRLLCSNSHAVSLVPFWAVWPFETLLAPRHLRSTLGAMPDDELHGFADVLKTTLQAYDLLFGTPMPYSMGFHPRPSDGRDHPEWQFHAHIYPPLLRSASVRKHMVGFEMMGMPQRDLTPETAAQRLRSAMHKQEQ